MRKDRPSLVFQYALPYLTSTALRFVSHHAILAVFISLSVVFSLPLCTCMLVQYIMMYICTNLSAQSKKIQGNKKTWNTVPEVWDTLFEVLVVTRPNNIILTQNFFWLRKYANKRLRSATRTSIGHHGPKLPIQTDHFRVLLKLVLRYCWCQLQKYKTNVQLP